MNKHGLTLVEVIIAALILSMTVGGLLFIFSTEKPTVSRVARRIQAIDFARETLEELKNEVRADTWDDADPLNCAFVVDNTYTPGLPGTSELVTKFAPANRQYQVDSVAGVDPSTGYRSVTVTVDWTEPTESQ